MSIEILPNWHPFFVHYTIAFLSVGALLYCCAVLLPLAAVKQGQLLLVAHSCIWIGCAFTFLTIATGWLAFGSVAHGGVAHLPMVSHRNFAIIAAGLALVIGVITFCRRNTSKPSKLLLILVLPLVCLLMITGYKGAELVFRYGLGVQLDASETVLKSKTVHDNSDGHHDKPLLEKKAPVEAHDNSDGHHDKPLLEKTPPVKAHDNSDGHQHEH